MGQGGLEIASIAAQPSWSGLLLGNIELTEAKISDVNFELDAQWLKARLSESQTRYASPLSQINITKTKYPRSDENAESLKDLQLEPKDSSGLQIDSKSSKQLNKTTQTTPQSNKNQRADTLADKQAADRRPNRWLKFKNINITLKNDNDVMEKITDLSANIPFSGKPAQGALTYHFLGVEHTHTIRWNGKILIINELKGELAGVQYQWQLFCNPDQRNKSFQFRFSIPAQPISYDYDKPNMHFSFAADYAAASFILGGSLNNPRNWRGSIYAEAKELTITENQKIQRNIHFDFARCVGFIKNKVLSIPLAEALGHETTFLANGVIHNNLYGYGVVRVIANDESSKFFDEMYNGSYYNGSRFIHINQHPHHFLMPLATPDRRYCDIFIDGQLPMVNLRHHRSEHWRQLSYVLRHLKGFKNRELAEDGILEKEE